MKKPLLIFTAIFILEVAIKAQLPVLKVNTATYHPQSDFPTIQNSNASVLALNGSDTLRYFLYKHYYRNPTTPLPAPNTQYFTLLNPYPGTTFTIDYCGSIFLSATTVTITGLEGIVTRRANATSANVPLKLYLCNVNSSNLPIFPPLDSVNAVSTNTNNGSWIGGNFTTAVNVSGKFAVLYKNASNIAGDTLGLFINNACTPTSTCPAFQRFGEGLGVMRINGNFQTATNTFGTGTDYEFIVAPRVLFNINASVSVLTPTICTSANGSFSNTSTPFNLIENRQFNFNKFAAVWSNLSNTLLPVTDSIYNWNFSGSSTGSLTSKNANAFFNVSGTQTASLTIKYNKGRAGGQLPSVTDVATGSINVSSTNAPTLVVTGSSVICIGNSATLTVGGNSTFTWTNPPSTFPTIVVSPTTTTIYTVSGVNGACVGYQTFTVNVVVNPTVTISAPQSYCIGKTLTITASGATSYSWSTGSNNYSTTITSSFVGIQIISVVGQIDNCPMSTATKTITVNALPTVTLSSASPTACTKATGGNPVQLIGGPIGGIYSGTNVVNNVFTPSLAGTYIQSYSYTVPSTGCSNTATNSVQVLTCQTTGQGERFSNATISIFPNPSVNGILEIHNLEAKTTIHIYNLLGNLVWSQVCEYSSIKLDFSSNGKGLYIVTCEDTNRNIKSFKWLNGVE